MADTTMTVSTQAFDAHHARGGAAARAVAFAEGTTPAESMTFFGEEAEISRTARRGPFVVHVVFLVPANAHELTVSHVCRLPGLKRVVP